MGTKHAGEVPRTELRQISQAEVARIVRDAQRMRGEYIAGHFRSVGRGITRLARTLAAPAAPARSSQGVAGKP